MSQATIRCPTCGEMEAQGTTFCGTCGTQLDGAGGAGNIIATLLRRPMLAALLGGAGFSVVVVLLLAVLGSDGDNPSPGSGQSGAGAGDGSSLSSGASPSTTAEAENTPTPESTTSIAVGGDTETPAPTATSVPETPTPVPPTVTPVPPSPTPVPPTSTPIPLPTATSAPSVPAQKTSSLVRLSVAGGHGSSHRVGEQVQLCYGSLAGQYIRLLDFQPPGTLNNVLVEGVDDGTGGCLNGFIEPPTGFEVFRIEVWNASRTAVVDFAELWIIVVP